ncbi:hypothetical protein QUB05_20790 [Microcoleus sp. F10-C6]
MGASNIFYNAERALTNDRSRRGDRMKLETSKTGKATDWVSKQYTG